LTRTLTKTTHELRRNAELQAAHFLPLLAEARHLATSVVLGTHGRRQAGQGEEFWQFRSAVAGDSLRSIDWRRSARGDAHYIRQREWQAAQSVFFWIDAGRSMDFSGDPAHTTKGERAALLALTMSILLLRGGERVGLLEDVDPPRSGQTQIERIVAQLAARTPQADYDPPLERALPKGSRAVFLSDFLGDWVKTREALSKAADQGVTGALVQILDDTEEQFPFDGRTRFHSVTGALSFETLRARGVREAYLDRLAARKEALRAMCAETGWQYLCTHNSQPAMQTLIWLYSILERRR